MFKPGINFIISVLSISMAAAQHNVRIELKQLPEYHPAGSSIYIAGSFNGWNPQDEKFKFRALPNGEYVIFLSLQKGSYEYKITRGSWDKVECQKDGTGIANRTLKVEGDQSIEVAVEEWEDRFPAKSRVSTKSKNVQILDSAFWIPQLKKTRRIWIYLPPNYRQSKGRYDVIYMQDGQNVFDDATSFSGEWGIDEALDSAGKNFIVVAIDHGGDKRLNEYNPYDNERFGKGEGDAYVDFIVKTLKPYIDVTYRTNDGKKSTFIAGSSMGGLISMYAVLKYPKVFGGAGVFSPAFWVGPRIYDDIKAKGKNVTANIYFFAGKLEGERMVPDMLKAFEEMHAVSKSNMRSVIRDEGKHSESTWRKEFLDGFIFMQSGKTAGNR